MENLHQWDRDEKLFAIQALNDTGHPARGTPLSRLVVDDDPVVRGKAALALQGCDDRFLLEAADTLIDQRESTTTILALELLGFTRETDYAQRLEPLIGDADDRVVKAAIEAMSGLPASSARPLLEAVLNRYSPEWDRALRRTLATLDDPSLLPVLKSWYDQASPDQRPSILALAAGLHRDEADAWVRDRMVQILDEEDPRRSILDWLLDS